MKKALFSKMAGALLCSAGLIASSAAYAQDTTLTFDAAGNAIFGMLHASPGSFVDSYLFSVDVDASYASGSAVVGRTWFDGARLANYGITDISFFRVEGDGTRTALGSSFDTSAGIEFYPLEALTTGNYGFTVTGSTAIENIGGSYTGNLNLVAAPVPEPATYAMLLVGVGLLGFTARRRSNDKLG